MTREANGERVLEVALLDPGSGRPVDNLGFPVIGKVRLREVVSVLGSVGTDESGASSL